MARESIARLTGIPSMRYIMMHVQASGKTTKHNLLEPYIAVKIFFRSFLKINKIGILLLTVI